MPYDGTYSPGDQDYDNYNYYGNMPMQFPNSGWGGPRSPAFQQAAPMPQPRDYMSRDNGNVGNSAFATPGGVNFGNPMMNLFGMMAMQMGAAKLGMDFRNMAPLSAPDMSPMDYFSAKVRFRNSYDPDVRRQLYEADRPFLDAASGRLGNMAMTQQVWDQFNPAGSNTRAYESIYGRLGINFGGDLNNQSRRSIEALGQFNDSFLNTDPRGRGFGDLDFKGTYGYDRVQSVEAYDAAVRYGIGGLSGEKFADAVNKKEFGTSAGRNNSVFSAASEIFGKDKGFDELAQLMTKSLDGFQGLDSNKATDLLLKIQSASKAVNISSKAFMEYSSMFGQLYAAHGMGGITTANQLMDTAMGASVATTIGRGTGDVLLMDQNKNMDMSARNRLDQLGSPVGKKALAIAARYANMSADQARAIQIKGYGSFGEFMKSGAFQKLYDDPNSAGLEAFEQAFDLGGQEKNSILGAGQASRGAAYLSDYDRRDAARVMNIDQPGGWKANKLNEALVKSITFNTGLKSDMVKALIDQVSSVGEGGDEKAIRAKVAKMFPGMSPEERDRVSAQFAGEYRQLTNNQRYVLANGGFDSTAAASEAIAENSPGGRRRKAAQQAAAADDNDLRQIFHAISGDLVRGKGVKDGIKLLMNGSVDIDKLYKHDKDGNRLEFDAEYAKEAAKKMLRNGLQADQVSAAMETLNDKKNNKKVLAAAKAAKQYVLDQYGGEENADEAARNKASEAYDKVIRAGFKGTVDKINKVTEKYKEEHKNDPPEKKEERDAKNAEKVIEIITKIYECMSNQTLSDDDDDPPAEAPGKPNS